MKSINFTKIFFIVYISLTMVIALGVGLEEKSWFARMWTMVLGGTGGLSIGLIIGLILGGIGLVPFGGGVGIPGYIWGSTAGFFAGTTGGGIIHCIMNPDQYIFHFGSMLAVLLYSVVFLSVGIYQLRYVVFSLFVDR